MEMYFPNIHANHQFYYDIKKSNLSKRLIPGILYLERLLHSVCWTRQIFWCI